MKKAVSLVLVAAMSVSVLAGCSAKNNDTGSGSNKTLKVAAIETAYGAEMWKEVAAAFEKANPGVKVELTLDKNLEDVISPKMKSGDYPDVIHLAVGRTLALTETMTKDNAIRDLSGMLEMTVPGEEVKVKDKIVDGFLDTLVTNPYTDGKTYLSPMFYGPCGLFYDAAFLQSKGWEVPKTWDEMWELGEKAKAEGIALFTYPTTGYFDAFFYALLNETGGPEFFNRAMKYEEGIWDTPEATEAFNIVAKLASYTEKSTVANANDSNYLKNQQLILDHKALFVPNGTWIVDEMKDAPRADGFEWGFTALPAVTDGGDQYSYTFFEQVWSPKQAKNPELADQFMAYLYSDEAAAIFAKAGAIQPIKGISSKLEGNNKLFYSIYDNGAKAAMGTFATTEPVEGVSMKDSLFGTVDSVVSGQKTVDEWKAAVNKANDALRGAMK
ncbi:MAG: carbohydrate ABC transporter substrate-binding protein [Clostridiales bacterium]|nr:carbohydrate ABC transporter substrate-binding protein [Clostridiales bacterium]